MKKVISVMLCTFIFSLIGCASVTPKDLEIYHKKIEIENVVTAIEKSHGLKPTAEQSDKIQIHYDGQVVQEMTLEEFSTLVGDATIYNDILSAERDKRVYVQLRDKVWKITPGERFTTYIDILWQGKNKNILRKMTLKIELQMSKEGGMSKIRVMYRNVAEWITPISLSFNILLVLLLVLLI